MRLPLVTDRFRRYCAARQPATLPDTPLGRVDHLANDRTHAPCRCSYLTGSATSLPSSIALRACPDVLRLGAPD
jgi:hypothetical protein